MDMQKMSSSLMHCLAHGKNPSIAYTETMQVWEMLTAAFLSYIPQLVKDKHWYQIVAKLITIDYRYLGLYLWALQHSDSAVLDLFQDLLHQHAENELGCSIAKICHAYFRHCYAKKSSSKIQIVSCLSGLFTDGVAQLLLFPCQPEQCQYYLVELLQQVGSGFSDFVEQQMDFPGANALVRHGIVKMWYVPDGKRVVSKRTNPLTPELFLKEYQHRELLRQRIFHNAEEIVLDEHISLQLIIPFALLHDRVMHFTYSLSRYIDGVTLEDLLFQERNPQQRQHYLRCYRLILDCLYAHGILWDGIAPRNIILQNQEQHERYAILDFEKLRSVSQPVSFADRQAHCQGILAREELIALCTPQEIQTCFDGYFLSPEQQEEEDTLRRFEPRREVVAVSRLLQKDVLFVEKALWALRTPDLTLPYGSVPSPARLHFKVEHYLQCAQMPTAREYEEKTIAIFVQARALHLLPETCLLLSYYLSQIEYIFLFQELFRTVHPYTNAEDIHAEVQRLVEMIDFLILRVSDHRQFAQSISQATIKLGEEKLWRHSKAFLKNAVP